MGVSTHILWGYATSMGICYIYGAGDHFDTPPSPSENDLVIAADGGYTHLLEHKVRTDLIVGDFDSLSVVPKGIETIILPKEKNDTDLRHSLLIGLERGFQTFHIYGGTGKRPDHSLANLQCLAGLAEQGARGFIFAKNTITTAIKDGEILLPAELKGYVSVFAHSDRAEGVYETGLKYSLENATLLNTYPLGVSNEFIGQPSKISVTHGTLLIVYPRLVSSPTKGHSL